MESPVSPRTVPAVSGYRDSFEQLEDELRRLDVMLHRYIGRAARFDDRDPSFKGLYVTDSDVGRHLERAPGLPIWYEPADGEDARAFAAELAGRREHGRRRREATDTELRYETLCNRFGLSEFERDFLFVALAPELDTKYERLFGYIQDDVTKKRPAVELALNLITASPAEKWGRLGRLGGDEVLVRSRLVTLVEDGGRPRGPLLSRYVKVDDRVVAYLLGNDDVAANLRAFVDVFRPVGGGSADQPRLDPSQHRLNEQLAELGPRRMVAVEGSTPAARRLGLQRALEAAGRPGLFVDVPRLLAPASADPIDAARLVIREARLLDAVPCLEMHGAAADPAPDARLAPILRELEGAAIAACVSGDRFVDIEGRSRALRVVRVPLSRPSSQDRRRTWEALVDEHVTGADAETFAMINRFEFDESKIEAVVRTAEGMAAGRGAKRIEPVDLHEACRRQATGNLSRLARKVSPRYTWDDIVLPEGPLSQLREIHDQMRHRATVLEDWGFDERLSLGKGLIVLFAGPSGTGKTMAADILAGAFHLDLYKIDLSTMVSKYIGETEKNLATIFAEASASSSVLFFDEADALFGKRSAVRDSHDRYANIEVSYLLQRIEEYEGPVILATNFRKNMDDAFVRRLHFVVDFPFPDVASRRRIWERIWPEAAPLDADLDLDLLAERFDVRTSPVTSRGSISAFSWRTPQSGKSSPME